MADIQTPTTADGSEALTLVEKLVELRLLVLSLAFLFYLDIWTIRAGINPMTFTAEQLGARLQTIPVFRLILFFASFSLLMGAFFPAVRYTLKLIRVQLGAASFGGRGRPTEGSKRLADWSLGLVVFSIYDLFAGWLSDEPYPGLAGYLTDMLDENSFEITIFRITCFFFWLVAVAIAWDVDR